MNDTQEISEQPIKINLNAAETPILYTDMIFMSVNEDGVTLDICQRVGQSNEVQVVSRVGMSASHAEKMVQQLGDLLMMKHTNQVTKKTSN